MRWPWSGRKESCRSLSPAVRRRFHLVEQRLHGVHDVDGALHVDVLVERTVRETLRHAQVHGVDATGELTDHRGVIVVRAGGEGSGAEAERPLA